MVAEYPAERGRLTTSVLTRMCKEEFERFRDESSLADHPEGCSPALHILQSFHGFYDQGWTLPLGLGSKFYGRLPHGSLDEPVMCRGSRGVILYDAWHNIM